MPIFLSVILVIAAILLVVFVCLPQLYFKFEIGKWFYHDLLGWHISDKEYTIKGYCICSTCKICKQDIMEDSQGNWFTY